MTVESLSNIIEQSLNSVHLEKLTKVKAGTVKEQIIAILKFLCKDYLGAAESELQVILDYKESEFFRKYTRFLMGMVETSVDERHKFAEDIQRKSEDSSGNVILNMVDRLDNIHKETVLAKLSVAQIHGVISIENFFRLHSLLERIPYVDLKLLPQCKEPFYDESGDTELLYATGALELASIDADGGTNKYVLSRLGEMLLRWGFNINIELEHGKGIRLGLISQEKLDEIFD